MKWKKKREKEKKSIHNKLTWPGFLVFLFLWAPDQSISFQKFSNHFLILNLEAIEMRLDRALLPSRNIKTGRLPVFPCIIVNEI